MSQLRLIEPSIVYEKQILKYRDDFIKNHQSFDGCSGLENYEDISKWLEKLKMYENSTTCPKDKVPSTTYLVVDEKNNLIGMCDLRHSINHPILSSWGGHIGYSISFYERKKGYGTKTLKLALSKAKEIGLKEVLVCCDEDNIGSNKIIKKNNGTLINTIFVTEINCNVNKYLIKIK